MHQDDFSRFVGQTSPHPLGIEIVRASGYYLYTPEGKKLLDMTSGVGVTAVGHCEKYVLEKTLEQMSLYMHVMVYGEFIQKAQTELAKKLASLLPPSLSVTYFTNSGAEAVEGALKLAMTLTGKSHFVAFEGSYHGDTLSTLSLCGVEEYRKPFSSWMRDVTFLPYDDIGALERITSDVAGVIIEPVQAETGIRIPTQKFLQTLREKTKKSGAFLIFDEVQTGLGRTGKWFAFQHFGVVPDVLILAKALGGGLPLGAFCSSLENMRAFSEKVPFGHISTTGGNPVSCAAGLATLRTLARKRALLSVSKNSPWLLSSLREFSRKFPFIQKVRGIGYLLALELDSDERAKKVAHLCLQMGLLTTPFLFHTHALRLYPALTMPRPLLENALSILNKALFLARE
ncbi:MAG: aspartate aminotransferase family protein [bacterium JZ-2024 1]